MKKENSTKALTIMVQPTLYQKLEKQCQTECRTMSEVVRECIVRYLEHHCGESK